MTGVNSIKILFVDSTFEAKLTDHSLHADCMKLEDAHIHAAFDMNLSNTNLSMLTIVKYGLIP